MSYDNNNRNREEGLAGLGILALIAAPFVAGYAIYRGVQANKKVDCYLCKKTFPNKELKILKVRWNPYEEHEKIPIKGTFSVKDNENGEIRGHNITTAIINQELLGIELLSDWPEEHKVPDDFRQECDSYFDKKVCHECAKKILIDLIERSKSLAEHATEKLEKSKLCCPRCNVEFLPNDLIRLSPTGLPRYWVIEHYGDKKICKNCRSAVLASEQEKFCCTKDNSDDIGLFPKSYKGNIGLDHSSIKSNIVSGIYRNMDEALNELQLRAFLEGFDVVFDYAPKRSTETEGTYSYSLWSVTGSFAKYMK